MRQLVGILFCILISCNSGSKGDKQADNDVAVKSIGKFTISGESSQVYNQHTQGYIDLLIANGFYLQDARRKKVTASSMMIKYEGMDFEEVEQKDGVISIFNYFYESKNLAYQLGVDYNNDGLMELVALQIHYMNSKTGKILTTHKIR